MKHFKEYEIEIDVSDDGDKPEIWSCEVEIKTSVDSNYGADADGNRGIRAVFIEDFKVLSTIREDGEKVPTQVQLEAIESEIMNQIEKESLDDMWEST